MSDFDKEAERERLREKYEQEQQDRQATEKMSELLLQGATMTNAHCSDCGDPVFRYEGQEFCATCEKAVDRGDGAGEPADGSDADADNEDSGADGTAAEASEDGARGTPVDGEAPEDAEHIHVASPDETRVQFGSGDADGETARSVSPSRSDRDPEESGPDAGREPQDHPAQPPGETTRPQPDPASEPTRAPGIDPSPAASPGGRSPDRDARSPDRDAGAPDRDARSPDRDAGAPERRAGTLPEARDSLERTLARLTRQAETADDPTRAREYLTAAREAAEALAALRQ